MKAAENIITLSEGQWKEHNYELTATDVDKQRQKKKDHNLDAFGAVTEATGTEKLQDEINKRIKQYQKTVSIG
jgi:hypothetical protein